MKKEEPAFDYSMCTYVLNESEVKNKMCSLCESTSESHTTLHELQTLDIRHLIVCASNQIKLSLRKGYCS